MHQIKLCSICQSFLSIPVLNQCRWSMMIMDPPSITNFYKVNYCFIVNEVIRIYFLTASDLHALPIRWI